MNVGSVFVLLRQRENEYSGVQRTLINYQASVDVLYLVSSNPGLTLINHHLVEGQQLADVQLASPLSSLQTRHIPPPHAHPLPSYEHLAHRRPDQPPLCLTGGPPTGQA